LCWPALDGSGRSQRARRGGGAEPPPSERNHRRGDANVGDRTTNRIRPRRRARAIAARRRLLRRERSPGPGSKWGSRCHAIRCSAWDSPTQRPTSPHDKNLNAWSRLGTCNVFGRIVPGPAGRATDPPVRRGGAPSGDSRRTAARSAPTRGLLWCWWVAGRFLTALGLFTHDRMAQTASTAGSTVPRPGGAPNATTSSLRPGPEPLHGATGPRRFSTAAGIGGRPTGRMSPPTGSRPRPAHLLEGLAASSWSSRSTTPRPPPTSTASLGGLTMFFAAGQHYPFARSRSFTRRLGRHVGPLPSRLRTALRGHHWRGAYVARRVLRPGRSLRCSDRRRTSFTGWPHCHGIANAAARSAGGSPPSGASWAENKKKTKTGADMTSSCTTPLVGGLGRSATCRRASDTPRTRVERRLYVLGGAGTARPRPDPPPSTLSSLTSCCCGALPAPSSMRTAGSPPPWLVPTLGSAASGAQGTSVGLGRDAVQKILRDWAVAFVGEVPASISPSNRLIATLARRTVAVGLAPPQSHGGEASAGRAARRSHCPSGPRRRHAPTVQGITARIQFTPTT